MFKKILILVPVCLILSACVLYAPTYVTQTSKTVVHLDTTSTSGSYNSNVTQETTEVSERVVPKDTIVRRPSLAVCGSFILPREVVPAVITNADLEAAPDAEAIDVLLGGKVLELQTYIEGMHSRIEQAHVKWMESCNQKLLD